MIRLKMSLVIGLILAASATCFAQSPDLTITEVLWRKKPHTVQIVVANVGKTKASTSTGSYACRSAPNEKGISLSSGSQFGIPALVPNQKWKIVLDCKGDKITGVAIDVVKKIVESDENNNDVSFADVQIKTGPIKKPGS